MLSFSVEGVVIGLIGLILGAWMIKDAYNLNHHIYFLDWIERKYGSGSGTSAYRLIGLVVCIFSVFVLLGIIDVISSSTSNPTPANQNQIIVPTNNRTPGVNIAQ
jgi:hypothetical protein